MPVRFTAYSITKDRLCLCVLLPTVQQKTNYACAIYCLQYNKRQIMPVRFTVYSTTKAIPSFILRQSGEWSTAADKAATVLLLLTFHIIWSPLLNLCHICSRRSCLCDTCVSELSTAWILKIGSIRFPKLRRIPTDLSRVTSQKSQDFKNSLLITIFTTTHNCSLFWSIIIHSTLSHHTSLPSI